MTNSNIEQVNKKQKVKQNNPAEQVIRLLCEKTTCTTIHKSKSENFRTKLNICSLLSTKCVEKLEENWQLPNSLAPSSKYEMIP